VVFGRGGSRRRWCRVKHGDDAQAPHGTRCAAARGKSGACDEGLAARRWRALGRAARVAALVGADGLFFVVLPDEATVHAGLQRHGDVEADGHQRGEQQSA